MKKVSETMKQLLTMSVRSGKTYRTVRTAIQWAAEQDDDVVLVCASGHGLNHAMRDEIANQNGSHQRNLILLNVRELMDRPHYNYSRTLFDHLALREIIQLVARETDLPEKAMYEIVWTVKRENGDGLIKHTELHNNLEKAQVRYDELRVDPATNSVTLFLRGALKHYVA